MPRNKTLTACKVNKGFTFVELMVASALAGMIFVALASVQGSFSMQQMSNYRRIMMENQASYSGKIMRRELLQASHIQAPGPGLFNDYILGGKNVDPKNLNGPGQITGMSKKYFYFCVGGTDPDYQLVYFTGDWPPPLEFPTQCPDNPPAGSSRETLAGYPIGVVQFLGQTFQRIVGQDNLIAVNFTLSLSQEQKAKFKQDIVVDVKTTIAAGIATQTN